MTICIAAVFEHKNESHLVLCHDWLGTVDAVGTCDEVDKQRWLGPGWSALISGNTAYAEEFCLILEDAFCSTAPTEQTILDTVRQAAFNYKKKRTNQHLGNTYAIDFKTLCDQGRSIFSRRYAPANASRHLKDIFRC